MRTLTQTSRVISAFATVVMNAAVLAAPPAGEAAVTMSSRTSVPGPTPGSLRSAKASSDAAYEAELLEIESPGVGVPGFAIKGEVRTGAMPEPGHLFMLSDFDAGTFFSKGVAPEGPMRSLSAGEDWRAFALPFYVRPEDGVPSRIRFGVSMPAGGEIELRGVRLTTLEDAGFADSLPAGAGGELGGWWTPRASTIGGAVLGSLAGVLGAAVGAAGAFGRIRLATGLLAVAFVPGVVSLLLLMTAIAVGQPSWVVRPLVVLGLVLTLVPMAVYPGLRAAKRDIEMRRVAAMDAG